MRLRVAPVVALFALAVSLPSPAAQAEDALVDARQRMDKLQYREAEEALRRARSETGLSHAQLVEILELQGVSAAAIGNSEEAEKFFRELVVLEPEFKLPKRWGPKIQTTFFAAKSWLDDQQPMTLSRQPAQVIDGKVVGVQVQLGPDPLQIVHRVRVHLRPEGGTEVTQTREVQAPATVPIAVSPSTTVRWWAESLGEHDEMLQLLASAETPIVDQAPAPAAPTIATLTATPAQAAGPTAAAPTGGLTSHPPEASPPFRPVAYALGGVGAAALITGAVFAVIVSNDNSQLQSPTIDSRGRVVGLSQAQANALVNQAQQDALLANIFFVSGGVLVAGGAGLWIWGAMNPDSGSGGEIGLAGRW